MAPSEYPPGSLEDPRVYPRVYKMDDAKWLSGALIS